MIIYQIEAGTDSPSVYMDSVSGVVEIKGPSAQRFPSYFYLNLARWLRAFQRGEEQVNKVDVRLTTVNQASAQWLAYVLKEIAPMAPGARRPIINWHTANAPAQVTLLGLQLKASLPLEVIIVG